MNQNAYEMVIGLEVHVELKTKTKIFCGCPTDFGAAPNTQCCPVCMGHPGTLPVLNEKVVAYAVKAGIATNCEIAYFSKQDRKNYFYPDLPKAYQISQYDLPLCTGGHLMIETPAGPKRIGITRIHIEEDAGKLIHDETLGTLIDCNRCGVPLIEIVSEPDIRSAEEAVAYLQKLRAVILYTGISDCKMNEGSLRCDVNLSVRKAGEERLGTRTEMKNLNSFQFISKAIAYEYKRQAEILEAGEAVVQETRRFDQNDGKTYSMRKKEDADDYRYFPDPDLPPIEISPEAAAEFASEIPELPDSRKARYMKAFGLSSYDSELLTAQKESADYFQQCLQESRYPKILANLMISEVFRLTSPDEMTIPIPPSYLACLSNLYGDEAINSSTVKRVLKEMWHTGCDPAVYVQEHDLQQIQDEAILRPIVETVLRENEKSVADYKKGKVNAAKSLMGQIMGRTSGRGNPVILQRLLNEYLTQESIF